MHPDLRLRILQASHRLSPQSDRTAFVLSSISLNLDSPFIVFHRRPRRALIENPTSELRTIAQKHSVKAQHSETSRKLRRQRFSSSRQRLTREIAGPSIWLSVLFRNGGSLLSRASPRPLTQFLVHRCWRPHKTIRTVTTHQTIEYPSRTLTISHILPRTITFRLPVIIVSSSTSTFFARPSATSTTIVFQRSKLSYRPISTTRSYFNQISQSSPCSISDPSEIRKPRPS